jgi:signal transduction histidine kinase
LRLPLLICALIAVVLMTFLAVTTRLVEQTLLRAGTARAQTTAVQLAAILAQQTAQRLAEARRLASSEAVRGYLKDPNDNGRAAAGELLRGATIPGQQVATLWAGGAQLLDGRDDPHSSLVGMRGGGTSDAPVGSGIGALRAADNVVFFDIVATVTGGEPAVERAPGDAPALGYVVVRRTASSAQTASILSGLIGNGARLELGSPNGGVWTDYSAVVPAPGIDLTRPGGAAYRGAQGSAVGWLSPVAGTPWLLWIEFSRDELLGPARVLLRRMLALALACIVLAALLVGVVSSRITTPLHALTLASEAIVAGDYALPVTSRRRDEIGRLSAAFNTMSAHVRASREELEARVRERTEALESAVKELEAFSYSVSHDLRAPLRAMTGFARILLAEHLQELSAEAAVYLRRVSDGAQQMGRLVDDLLAFARLGRAAVRRAATDPAEIAREALVELQPEYAGRGVRVSVAAMPPCEADPVLLKQVYANLLSNALKFTRPRGDDATIDVGCETGERPTAYFVKDNGVGFDMRYADKLFGVFQRLHRAEDYEGTGVGLAIVERIVSRHGGRVWADAGPDRGACFYFTIGSERR